jgi:hypothetical protein
MILSIALAASSYAQEECRPLPDGEWVARMNAADRMLASGAADEALVVLDAARQRLACTPVKVEAREFGRFARQLAFMYFLDQDKDEATHWVVAARWTDPAGVWPEYTPEAMNAFVQATAVPATPPTSDGFMVEKGQFVLVNGRFLAVPSIPPEMPALLQVLDRAGRPVRTAWQDGNVFPADLREANGEPMIPPKGWVADPPPPPAPACEPLAATEVGREFSAAHLAIDEGNFTSFDQIWTRLQPRLSCLTGPVPRDLWAAFLVDLAVAEHGRGGDWQTPLAGALDIDPRVARHLAPDDVRTWAAPPVPATSTPAVPKGAEYFLDGKPITMIRPMPGMHLIQRKQGDAWSARIVRDGAFPADWRSGRGKSGARAPGGGPTWVAVTVAGGVGSSGQRVEAPSDFLPDTRDTGAALGIGSTGQWAPGALGVAWNLTSLMQLGVSPGVDAQVSLRAGAPTVGGLAGVGVWTVDVATGDKEGVRTFALLLPQIGATVDLPAGNARWMSGANVGLGPQGLAIDAWALASFGSGPLRWVGGIDGSSARGAFVQDGTNLEFGATRWRLGLRAGVAFGGPS